MPSGRAVLGKALRRVDELRPWRTFDRPIFIVAGPRTGSTLLFDLLAPHPDLVSWPFEAPQAYESVRPADHPVDLGSRWPPSYATPARRRALTRELYLGRLEARRRHQLPVSPLERLALRKVRIVEKTPSSITRLGALAGMFPDAKLIVLQRDAPATIASIIEVWETPGPAHATLHIGGREIRWTMLPPPGWLSLVDAPSAVKAAFQWAGAAQCSLDDMAALDPGRYLQLTYEELTADPGAVLRRVLDFAELSPDPAVLRAKAALAAKGRTSLSAARPDKWRERAEQIEPLLPALAGLRSRLGYEV